MNYIQRKPEVSQKLETAGLPKCIIWSCWTRTLSA